MSILNKEHIQKPICLSILCLLVMVETDYIGLISRLPSNGQEGLMVGALVSGSSGLGQGHRVMFMGRTLYSPANLMPGLTVRGTIVSSKRCGLDPWPGTLCCINCMRSRVKPNLGDFPNFLALITSVN